MNKKITIEIINKIKKKIFGKKDENKNEKNIVIIASGIDSKLNNYTKNIVPNILISIDNKEPFFCKLMNYWNNIVDNIYIIIQSEYIPIIQYYQNEYIESEINKKIHIEEYNSNDGTAQTLYYFFYNYYKKLNFENIKKSFIVSSCEILPINQYNIWYNNKIPIKHPFIIYTYGNESKFIIEEETKISKADKNGNIIGLYKFNEIDMKKINYMPIAINLKKNEGIESPDLIDIIDYIEPYYTSISINKIIDIGDMNKLRNIIDYINEKKIYKCKYFNNIIDNNNGWLEKIIIHNNGLNIIKNEIEF